MPTQTESLEQRLKAQAQQLEILRLVLDCGGQHVEGWGDRVVELASLIGQFHRLPAAREQLAAGEVLQVVDPPR